MTFFDRIREFYIRERRKGDKKEDFIAYFTDKGISEALVVSIYQYFQNWVNLGNFPVRPHDNIYKIYGIVDEDLDDLILEISKENNLQVPENTDYWEGQIVTVEDLIQFVATFPRMSIYE